MNQDKSQKKKKKMTLSDGVGRQPYLALLREAAVNSVPAPVTPLQLCTSLSRAPCTMILFLCTSNTRYLIPDIGNHTNESSGDHSPSQIESWKYWPLTQGYFCPVSVCAISVS